MKICLICGNGGHLVEMRQLFKELVDYNCFLITYLAGDTRNLEIEGMQKVYLLKSLYIEKSPILRSTIDYLRIIIDLIQMAMRQLLILTREKPDVILATGSEISIPMCYIAKFLRKTVIFIESLARVFDLSLTGKLVYYIADLFLVQWKTLTEKYERAKYVGTLAPFPGQRFEKEEMIFVTVGSVPFERLTRKIDEIAKKRKERIIMQIGITPYKPQNAEFFTYKSYAELEELNRKAKVVVCPGGVGSIFTALKQGTRVIVIPRLRRYGEVTDDHQLELTKELRKMGAIHVVYDVDKELESVMDNYTDLAPRKIRELYSQNLATYIRCYLNLLSNI